MIHMYQDTYMNMYIKENEFEKRRRQSSKEKIIALPNDILWLIV